MRNKTSVNLSKAVFFTFYPPFFVKKFSSLAVTTVRIRGFEPPTPWSQAKCATKLRYIRIETAVTLRCDRCANLFSIPLKKEIE